MVTKTPTPTTPADEPDKRETKQLVLRAQARLALLKSHRARTVDDAGQTLVLFEYVRPDRYRQVTNTKEQIGIGDLLYTRYSCRGRPMDEARVARYWPPYVTKLLYDFNQEFQIEPPKMD